MAKRQPRQGIPTNLSVAQFEQFVLPHLSKCRRGPATKLGWHTIFNYILRLLYLGCQWNVSMAGTIAGRAAKPFSPRHGSQHQFEFTRSKAAQARTQAPV